MKAILIILNTEFISNNLQQKVKVNNTKWQIYPNRPTDCAGDGPELSTTIAEIQFAI